MIEREIEIWSNSYADLKDFIEKFGYKIMFELQFCDELKEIGE